MAPQLKYPPVFLTLALLLGLSLFPVPASANAQTWQWNSLPTGTAVSINSPSTTTGTLLAQGNTTPTTRDAASATSANSPASPATAPVGSSMTVDPSSAGIMGFNSIRLGLNANPPAQCTAPLYGTITARAPDGALCLCHQSYDGKQSIWEQIGTGRSCWPDQK
jgi:hypothetical protein